MDIQSILKKIAERPELFDYYNHLPSAPSELISQLRDANTRGYITRDELENIARLKNGGKLSGRVIRNIHAVSELAVSEISKLSFAATNEEIRIRLLLCLGGVRLRVATAILSWVYPDKFPVLDFHTLKTFYLFCSENSKKGNSLKNDLDNIEVWLKYLQFVRSVSVTCGKPPQAIDRWMYGYDKAPKS